MTQDKIDKNTLENYLNPTEWRISEKSFDVAKINFYETLFTIGNGFLGTRGSLEEGHSGALPGTFINGIYDHFDSFVVELVNAPSWFDLAILVDGHQLDLESCQILDFERSLDLKAGLLFRRTRFQDQSGKITLLESLRYASMANRHLMETKVRLVPENYSGEIEVISKTSANFENLGLKDASKREIPVIPATKWKKWNKSIHFAPTATKLSADGIGFEFKTLERPYKFAYASKLQISKDSAIKQYSQSQEISEVAKCTCQQGEALVIEKLTAIFTNRETKETSLIDVALAAIKNAKINTFEERLKAHQKAWDQIWDSSDCLIEGNVQDQNALRFNLYQMLIAANPEDPTVNIPAKSLSGEGYKGHIFWDTEIFALPFFIYTQPESAKALLRYRYNTLPAAKAYAQESGCLGARYAWESADTGEETAPKWSSDGQQRFWTGEKEIHITAAVAFGLVHYYQVTGDNDFLNNYGLEILLETARFWNTRLELNAEKDHYEINDIIGPDEFHDEVNNNAYTNYLARWNLQQAIKFYQQLKNNAPEKLATVVAKINFKETELEDFNHKINKIFIPFDSKTNLIEQFDGYFNLTEVPIVEFDHNNMPVYPKGYGRYTCGTTTLVRQADVIMLNYLLPECFSPEIIKTNYDFYDERTMHISSLSPSIHAALGARLGRDEQAYNNYTRTVYQDLHDNMGNTDLGVHLASCGGTWQATVNGFAGMEFVAGNLKFNPNLPKSWTSLKFNLKVRNGKISAKFTNKTAEFEYQSEENQPIEITIGNQKLTITPNTTKSIQL